MAFLDCIERKQSGDRKEILKSLIYRWFLKKARLLPARHSTYPSPPPKQNKTTPPPKKTKQTIAF